MEGGDNVVEHMEEEVVNKMSETFADFSGGGEAISEINIPKEGSEIIISQEIVDYNNMTIEEIVTKANIPVLKDAETFPNFNQVFVHTKHFKLYLAKHDTLQTASLLVLNDIDKKKTEFGNLINKLARLNEINSRNLLKLKGVVVFETKAYLLFEIILSSYLKKINEKVPIETNFKFTTLFYLIETISLCHEKDIGLLDIRPSLLLFNNLDELRFLIPFGINIF